MIILSYVMMWITMWITIQWTYLCLFSGLMQRDIKQLVRLKFGKSITIQE